MKQQNENGLYRGHYTYSNRLSDNEINFFNIYAESPEDAEQRLKDIAQTGVIDKRLQFTRSDDDDNILYEQDIVSVTLDDEEIFQKNELDLDK